MRQEISNYKDMQSSDDKFYIDYHGQPNDYTDDYGFNGNSDNDSNIIVPRRKHVM